VIDGCLAFIENPAITTEELFEIIRVRTSRPRR